ncbi:MAG: alkaline phosphatase family protein [Chloroflexota bacterium]
MRRYRSVSPTAVRTTTALLLLLATIAGTATAPRTQTATALANQDSGLGRINHIVVIYLENHSFDNLFGTLPGADGLANATDEQRIQLDKQGNPFQVLPPPLAPLQGGVRPPDPRFPADLPNAPLKLNDFASAQEPLGDITHLFYREQYQINGGKMNGFAAWSDGAGMAMGYWETDSIPLVGLAREYTVADRFFHAAFGGSYLNHLWLVCACTPTWPGAPVDMVAKPFPNDPDHLTDLAVTPDGFVVNTAFTVNTPHPATTAADHLQPNIDLATIGERLSDAGVSWAWYSGGWNDAIAGKPDPLFQFHHQPFAYFTPYADGTQARADHLKDESDFLTALADGSLPAVSFVKPLGPENEHPRYAAVTRSEEHARDLVRKIQESPVWSDTVVIITYDEHGGFWDHVPPPIVDRWGPGLRVPTLVISPFAKRGFVDHTVYDTTSILKLIEDRWGLAPLGTRDAAAANMLNAFDFSLAP